jgi:hypothetical protein
MHEAQDVGFEVNTCVAQSTNQNTFLNFNPGLTLT